MKTLFSAAGAAALLLALPAAAQDHAQMDHGQMDHGQMDNGQMDHGQMSHGATDRAQADHAPMAMNHAEAGALGAYPMGRDASGTAWQPDASPHHMGGRMVGPWSVMTHAQLYGVYDWQEGPRGGEKSFVAGMAMASARRALDNGDTLTFTTMLSPDPFMGKSGYPLHLASGETANGIDPLIDRQHPHDLFMELSAAYAHRLGAKDSVFIYAGLPGEPAFGPPTFMHRLSIMDSPEAPISHHWLDSTHITFGVVTAGFVHDDWKLEVSRFKGREPDEKRFNFETPKLDSTAARVSWNPTANWSLQASWADMKSPEQLEPEMDQTRWSASGIYTVPVGAEGWWSTTAAWGRRTGAHQDLDAFTFESALKPNAAWTAFARAERAENDELLLGDGDHHHGPAYKVGKLSVGAIRDFRVNDHVSLGLGGLYAWNFVPDALEASYGGDPNGAMAFLRLTLR
ncbi:hypothetical protein [Phenylobacterium deserti]|uniref:Uncharacterized protein n=1 Tax=Phenylobacterium deserti TaxID=1914756 RepID=A0A328AQ12_9CAUL|nr:hypothetical protein [Phenylobacterium deserti]RAK57090.1 hypothetical protein DJ018_03790 [Phenylobacterium deserti]